MAFSVKECPDCKSININEMVEKQYDEDRYNCSDCNRTWSKNALYCKACLDVVIYCGCHN